MTGRALFDPGLQPERTELAWRRTALAIGVGSLLSLRVLPAVVGDPVWAAAWLIPGIAGLAFAVLLWFRAQLRHRRVTAALLDGRPEDLPGSGLMLMLTLFVVGCGVLSAVVVLWWT
ncbi:DUF202 domain-containing protein [Microbacterium kyungheense]|uniref:Uncharacterized protein DUF202 n=1 Tax=Microbacterium kyungheense TaxID=1263636 RepID=A0A543F2E5_9MICO|nr:DUF202 domain-containing protein [Microbacterium kyungheense]TQM28003.1 uncharacterized protein DUF202 [Microbacterium kyungheense]